MSDAQVKFYNFGMDAGVYPPASEASRFGFKCPKGRGRCSGLLIAGRNDLKRDGNGQNGGVPMWDFDGNVEAPTFTPSINCGGCWHGHITKGRCVDVHHVDEPEPPAR